MIRRQNDVAAVAGCTLIITHDGQSEWHFATQEPDSNTCIGEPAFTIRATGLGSGLGAFATRAIARGECIVSEAQLVQWTLKPGERTTAGLVALVNGLSPADREVYGSLSQNPMHGRAADAGGKSVYGIWLSNCYPCTSPMQATRDRQNGVDDDEIQNTKAVYASVCRYNHSCCPNAHVSWNAKRGQQVIYALRHIEPGAEICVSYLDNASGTRRAQRHEELGFACVCDACSLSGVLLAQSDQRRSRIGVIFGLLEATIRAADKRAMPLVVERLRLLEEEGMLEDWNTAFVASSYFSLIGDRRQACQWAARAAESAKHGLGTDSDEFEHYAAHAAHR